MNMFSSLFRTLRAKPIVDPSELRRFLSGEASYLAQRMTYEFSRNTLAWFGQHYFADPGFNDAFRKCRWESFGLLAADMVIMTFARMPDAQRQERVPLGTRMEALFGAVLREYPVPEHRSDGWSDLESGFAARIAAVQPPVDPVAFAEKTAKAVFKTLPVFSENRAGDYQVVFNAVHFGLVAFADRLRRRVAAEPAAKALLAGEPLDRDLQVPVS